METRKILFCGRKPFDNLNRVASLKASQVSLRRGRCSATSCRLQMRARRAVSPFEAKALDAPLPPLVSGRECRWGSVLRLFHLCSLTSRAVFHPWQAQKINKLRPASLNCSWMAASGQPGLPQEVVCRSRLRPAACPRAGRRWWAYRGQRHSVSAMLSASCTTAARRRGACVSRARMRSSSVCAWHELLTQMVLGEGRRAHRGAQNNQCGATPWRTSKQFLFCFGAEKSAGKKYIYMLSRLYRINYMLL